MNLAFAFIIATSLNSTPNLDEFAKNLSNNLQQFAENPKGPKTKECIKRIMLEKIYPGCKLREDDFFKNVVEEFIICAIRQDPEEKHVIKMIKECY
jgi:hypothetical protein